MPRNDATKINRSLRQMNDNLGKYKATEMKKDWDALEPKDRLEFYLKITKMIIDNKELLKTDATIAKESEIIISFFEEN